MIAIIYGTTGELIKIAPLLLALKKTQTPHVTWCTGQQPEQIPGLLTQFGLPQPDVWFAQGRHGVDLEKNTDIPRWVGRVLVDFARQRTRLRQLLTSDRRPPLVVVHGDTLTTIIGAAIGRLLRVNVAHVEAGYRSGDWRSPFPEELVRRAVARIARIHYASGPHTAANLRREGTRGIIVDTGYNTIRDSVELAEQAAVDVQAPDGTFGIVSLHRYELLNNSAMLRETVETLRASAESGSRLLFIDHPVTARAIAASDLDGLFGARFERIPRQTYFDFMALLRRSSFLVTDSGGSQQECWQLGHPCLVHRSRTEHTDSVGGSVVVSGLDFNVLRSFLSGGWRDHRTTASSRDSPTAAILAHLERRGYVGGISSLNPV